MNLKEHNKEKQGQMHKQTIGPLHTIGASLSTRNPMDIHRTPWFSTGIIFISAKTNLIIDIIERNTGSSNKKTRLHQ